MKKATLAVATGLTACVLLGVVVFASTRKEESVRSSPSASVDFHTHPAHPSGEVATQAEETDHVTIYEHEYKPSRIRVRQGTTVIWTSATEPRHDVFPDGETASFTASPLLSQGQTYSYTFTVPGTYGYYSTTHQHMKGVVEVTQ